MSETNTGVAVVMGAAVPVGSGQIAPANESVNLASGQTAVAAALGLSSSALASLAPIDPATLAAAALASNAAPAPTDPIASALDNLHTRMTAIETALNPVAGIAAAVIPGASTWMERLAALEAAAEGLVGFASSATPLLTRVENAFNVHFGGKV